MKSYIKESRTVIIPGVSHYYSDLASELSAACDWVDQASRFAIPPIVVDGVEFDSTKVNVARESGERYSSFRRRRANSVNLWCVFDGTTNGAYGEVFGVDGTKSKYYYFYDGRWESDRCRTDDAFLIDAVFFQELVYVGTYQEGENDFGMEILNRFSSEEYRTIKKALRLARSAHFRTRRQECTPYFLQSIKNGKLVLENGSDDTCVAVAMLDDTRLNAYLAPRRIFNEFGKHSPVTARLSELGRSR